MKGAASPTGTLRGLLLLLVLLAAACTSGADETTTTTTTAAVEETSTTTTLYPKDENGIVTRPWVRLHAAKDYADMAELVGRYPDLRVSFNLTPVLLLQLEEIMNGTRDTYWVHTEIPADELSAQEREFLLTRFFDVNPKIIARFPGYQDLADKRAAEVEFSTQDYLDLQVLFNLAWTDPDTLATSRLSELVDRGHGFTEADKQPVLQAHLDAVAGTLDIHTELWEQGQIEVTTSPLAHPILPLISDETRKSKDEWNGQKFPCAPESNDLVPDSSR